MGCSGGYNVAKRLRVLVLGATGMLGHVLYSMLSDNAAHDVKATVRGRTVPQWFPEKLRTNVLIGVDAFEPATVRDAIQRERPHSVVNCIGIVKQLPEAKDPLVSIAINSLFPHQLAKYCDEVGARLIHVSTDCVFSGNHGPYGENDNPDATDLYGRTKLLGEVASPPAVTLRTSIIGHELQSHHGLLEWFLSQEKAVSGYARAIFSGFPTVELARIIMEHVIPKRDLNGLYHISSHPLSKLEFLRLIALHYGKNIDIVPTEDLVCDRSLLSERFQSVTGYRPPSWPELVRRMHDHYLACTFYKHASPGGSLGIPR
jgi:dTDP-4-dehydrorhamnose reductase